MDDAQAKDINLDDFIEETEVLSDIICKKQMDLVNLFIEAKEVEFMIVYKATEPGLFQGVHNMGNKLQATAADVKSQQAAFEKELFQQVEALPMEDLEIVCDQLEQEVDVESEVTEI